MNLALEKRQELLMLIDQSLGDFKNISNKEWDNKPSVAKWSKKETLGHLIDSAANNLRRFIVGQYEQGVKIVYQQNEWVAYQNYQAMDIEDLKRMWELANKQIVNVLHQLPEDKLLHVCDTGKGKVELRTLAYLINDYVEHLNHHIAQITA